VPLAVTFLAEFTSLTSLFLLLSVMPMLAAAAGTGSSGAGLITGSLLLGTVAAVAVAAAAIRRFGYRMVLAAGAVLLGAPALAMLVREPQAVMVSVSVVRGFGFGLSGVVTGALVQAITATLSRWQAGKHGDRYGHARLLIPALAVAALGMAAMIALGSPVAIFAGMVLFGAGFGVIENATFAQLIEQLPEAKASALWNLAYDAGYGAGPALFGLMCVRTGYPAAFALSGVLILATLPVALRERKAAVPALAGQLARRKNV
jgi:MFS family permease